MELTEKIMQWVRKYRFVILILVIGIALMLIPFGGKEETIIPSQTQLYAQPEMQLELGEILSKIDGAGKVDVMLSVSTSQSTVYQSDISASNGTSNQDTVIVTDESRTQNGLIQHVIYPQYRGAIIVCQGADNMQVRLNIMEAVSRITGLGMDKISVLKMK
jgi:stage III sporulation protein AG